ncbi:hypothetical protein, unlikely [Trypanosoma brucei gambiense DAL972]|uniref:Uncharacterized protein n=1 Tax=Trypanosoma brucei gambiense (strain MHOM/CI/86/DAL972) TaxID=679716 RepID=D0A791_TRYB9|nr:hypothetical protein, unlikely [Trypanosoma brucei gambiense DAL972]CBH17542.1 hypothetical protein, unlikely [Trypanosoma brucei gambiense DAL972]|eukprot:XP_011779806.1 hypothetical protein, unlikely [Trypanosoma brucei gambiense DAL972]
MGGDERVINGHARRVCRTTRQRFLASWSVCTKKHMFNTRETKKKKDTGCIHHHGEREKGGYARNISSSSDRIFLYALRHWFQAYRSHSFSRYPSSSPPSVFFHDYFTTLLTIIDGKS